MHALPVPSCARRWLPALALYCAASLSAPAETPFPSVRPTAVPLVVSDPMLSIWSHADNLTDDTTRHWTRHEHALVSLLRIDGKPFTLMGKPPGSAAALPQKSLVVTPTRTIYDFEGEGVHVTLTFMTPALPDDLEVLARPVTYLTWSVRSVDGAEHEVSVYESTSSHLAVNEPSEKVQWKREAFGPLTALRAGTEEQELVGHAGDDARINWGYAYAVAAAADSTAVIGPHEALTSGFLLSGKLPPSDDPRMPRRADDDQPVLAFVFDLGKVGAAAVDRHLMVGYDEVAMIKFFHKNLKPFWRRNGATPSDLFQAAERDYDALVKRCNEFDRALLADATKAGGENYAKICALAYRQCLAGHGFAADSNGQPLMFTKENTSNGDIATTDVMFPANPQLLFISPTLAKASLVPTLAYTASDHWRFPNAPHDLGTYPIARGTDDGGEQMPVEESGNMILLCDAISQLEGNTSFVEPWWPQLSQWAKFLEKYGLDPENQLCTDDFMGHLAHNANLSVKAILALAAFGDMCKLRGDKAEAERYAKLAKEDAEHWVKVADDGDHSRLAFDKPGTWSQKYNLVWDKILNLNVFPPEIAAREVAFYKTKLNEYGVPLDSRTRLTKTDWTIWSATLAENPADFEMLVAPIVKYLDATTARQPFADSYETDRLDRGGMHARPVIGGVFIKMLADRALWTKWAAADKFKTGKWAPLPPKLTINEVIPTSQKEGQTWRYTTQAPPPEWASAGFNDSGWQQGAAGFGNQGPHHTSWRTSDIWIRKTWTIPPGAYRNLQFYVFHDEDVKIYINGVLAGRESGFVNGFDTIDITPEARALLKPGATVTVAAHCHQTVGGQGLDIGLVDVPPE